MTQSTTPATTPAGTPVTLDIGGPAHGGTAVARFGADAGDRSGQVVFVRGALPGETGVPVTLDRQDPGEPRRKRRFLTGEVADAAAITGPSPHRTAPACPAAAAGAGCCDLDIVDARGSVDWKQQVVTDQFTRIGHLDLTGIPVTVSSPEPFTGYRTRVRLGVDDHGRAGLRSAGSRTIVPVSRAVCAQWSPALAEGLADELADAELTPGAEVCVAVGTDGRRSIVELVKERTGAKTTRGRRSGRRRNGTPHRRTRRRIITGDGTVSHTVNGTSWTIPVEAFWQAHHGVAELYSDWIIRTLATPSSGPEAPSVTGMAGAVNWDLYGGSGVFSAALLTVLPAAGVDCVDVASAATAAGERALDGHDVRFITGDVAERIGDLRGSDGSLFAVVLDPPRTGSGDLVLEGVAARRPRHILHIGCDPATAARDAATLAGVGYRLDSLTAVDAFGLTHHVEVLAHYVPDTEQTPGAGQ